MERRVLGVVALSLIVVGTIGTFTNLFGADSTWWGGVALRTGLVLGVLWLVLPKAREVPRAVWAGALTLAGFIAIRPRLVAFGLVAALIAMFAVAAAQRRAAAK